MNQHLPILLVMLKSFGQLAGAMRAMTLRARYAILRRIFGDDRAVGLISETAARIPGLFGIYTRQAFYRCVLSRCGSDVHFGYQTLLSKHDAIIGDRVYFGRFCTVGSVTIGDDARIADGAQLLSGRHHHGSGEKGIELETVEHAHISIGKGAWIGANAVIMADVGDGAIVAAGAVVTRPVAPGITVAGVPARPIDQKTRPRRAA